LIVYYLYKNISYDMCHVFMCDRRDKNTNSQIKGSIKYMSNTYGGVI